MILAAIAKLNQYTDQNFINVMDQLTAAQEEGLTNFDLDVQMLDEDEIGDLVMALDVAGYTAMFNGDSYFIEVKYE